MNLAARNGVEVRCQTRWCALKQKAARRVACYDDYSDFRRDLATRRSI